MSKTIPPIVERNKDVEHIMLASAIYGMNGRGKKNVGKLFSMLAVADVHQSYAQMESAIDYLNYYDAFYFSKEFKKYTGLSPMQWKKQHPAGK